jgi:hypothetical protein
MVRLGILGCGLIVLAGCARLSAHRPEGKGVVGVFDSYQKGILNIRVHEREQTTLVAKQFRIDDDTLVTIFHGDIEKQFPAKEAFSDVPSGTPAIVRVGADDKVVGVQLGIRERSKRDK